MKRKSGIEISRFEARLPDGHPGGVDYPIGVVIGDDIGESFNFS